MPLQKGPREKQNSVFIDANLNPYPDQWAFLSSIEKMPQSSLEEILKQFNDENEIMGVRPVEINENEPWKLTPSRIPVEKGLYTPLPTHIDLILSDQIYIEKENLSPALRNRIIRLAAFQNPEFYRAQAMRFSTFGKPRVVCCCEEFTKHLAIPRGCLEELTQLLENLKIKFSLVDKRYSGKPITLNFQGTLYFEQELAVNQLKNYETGVLSASTSFGKTVVGIWLIAQRKVNTLIIVHRKQLMDQWKESLLNFLDIDKKDIGQFGGGKKKLTGKIDIAMIQSLGQKGIVNDLIADYGQIIFDECHHITAVSFEQVARRAKARYILGLSATITRKDGHHPIIFMQCGPVRYRVNDRQQVVLRVMAHKVFVRCTAFKLPDIGPENQQISIQEIYAMLAADKERNEMIIQDVLNSVQAGRSPVLLTERRDHLDYFVDSLSEKVKNIIVLTGGMSSKQRNEKMDQLRQIKAEESRLIISTGQYLGEGFDDARLDTLFLTLPISWRGKVAQYAGRLHRKYERKEEVLIYDYVDDQVPLLAGMFAKRKKAYKSFGYDLVKKI